MDGELRGRLERLDELLDLYQLLTPYWRARVKEEAMAVFLALLGWEDEPPRTWTR